ncbi:hypothetical protein CXG81DRAFT_18674 [Caulochytrium protostelioides]|uniref:Sm domain-containing protein n=1 Tax=Caulochytrium protostelioides TaxID=1555241 RepID=A0A4P9X8H1_9FUNG|nr:hypothetical protein CXG81DRAFT_18674 [Caulochytrium protostelioides]|eukprot:RKP01568.1 hypothetical protein CXG81DRAFT_18674 [Caulochytrium protostelioides]
MATPSKSASARGSEPDATAATHLLPTPLSPPAKLAAIATATAPPASEAAAASRSPSLSPWLPAIPTAAVPTAATPTAATPTAATPTTLANADAQQARATLERLLMQRVCITIADGRRFEGAFMAVDRDRNTVLTDAVEYCRPDEGDPPRDVGFIMIPGAHLVKFARC